MSDRFGVAIDTATGGPLTSKIEETTFCLRWSKEGKLQQMVRIMNYERGLVTSVEDRWDDVPTEAAEAERNRALAKLAEYEKWSLADIMIPALTAAYARGKAEENEACAELAENFDIEKTPVGNLPAAIRQRMGGSHDPR